MLYKIIIILSFILFPLIAEAAVCESTFAGPVATLDGGELNLDENSELNNTDNGSIYTDNLKDNDGTCDGDTCVANDTTVPSLSFTIDKDELGDSDDDLDIDSDTTISNDENYSEVKVKENTTLTLQGDITIRTNDTFELEDDCDSLVIDGHVILYVDEFKLGQNVTIDIKEGASLIIYVYNDTTFDKNSKIDTKNHPENFILLSASDDKTNKIDIDDDGTYEGFFYAKDDIKIGKNVEITGAVTGQDIEVKDDTKITYDIAAAQKLAISGVCTILVPIVDYHFDSCAWDGTSHEVIDYSGHALHATDINGTTVQDAKINHGASFDGTDDYIDLPDIDADFSQGFTISAWVRFDTDGSYQKIIEMTTGRGENGIALSRKEDTKKLNFGIFENMGDDDDDNDKYEGIETSDDVIDGDMHHIVATLDNNKHAKIYIDGVEKASDTFDFMPSNVTRTVNYIAKSTWTGDGDDYFGGIIDELKIFDTGLNATQVQTIYDNEGNTTLHKNYDGFHRMAVDCTTPVLLAEYHFDACKYTGATGEVIDTAGGDNNGTIIDDANLSKDEKKIGHALKLDGGAVDIDNLAVSTEKYKKNTVTFWMYWDGTNGKMPFGWEWNDLWTPDTYFGFNSSNGDLYGISSDGLANGWHHITAVFTNGDMYSNRLYIDGILQNLSQLQGTPNNTLAIANSSARIGGWTGNTDNRFTGYLDELKIYKGELNATTVDSLYNSEKDLVRDIICSQAIFNAVNRNGGCFNWDNNITTKIAGSPIDLTILSADENDNNNSLSDVNVTKLELLSFSDASCSTLYDTTELWSGNEEVNSSACFNPVSFTHNKAVKCAKIKITGIYDGNSVESNATDTFSIRPDKFVLTSSDALTQKLISEHDYTFQAHAVNSDGTTTTDDYNTSLTPANKKYFRDGSDGSAMDGAFLPTANFAFTNGVTADTTLSFNNVGDIGLDLNDTTWAEVDSDDTPLIDRTIYLEQNLTFIPDRFEITFDQTPTMDNHGRSFTYFANDLVHMSADLKNLDFKITALGEKGATMTNYRDPQDKWFANNIDLSLQLTVEQTPTLSAETITQSDFIGGVKTISYAERHFNFGRDRNVTKNPISLDGANSDINITAIDSIDHEVNATKHQTFTGNATFYYGRVITKDIKTNKTDVNATQRVQIYSTTPLTGFEQESLSWYLNKEDDFSDINYTDEDKRKLTTTATNQNSATNGKATFTIGAGTDKSYKKFYHLSIDPWLWYSRYEDYNFTTDSTCASHPCFEYIYEAANNTIGIKSGNFKGASFDNNFTYTRKRKAIKIMR